MKNIIKIFLFILVISFTSCEKDNILVSTTIDIPDPEIIPIVTSLVVYVNDFWGVQARAFVTVNGETTQTDEFGRAFIKLKGVNRKGDLVTIESDNRITVNRRILLEPGKKNIQKIYLERINFKNGNNTDETTTIFTSNATITIPPNSLKYKDGSGLYSGVFSVKYEYIAGDDPLLAQKLPGALQHRSDAGNLSLLQTYGMIKVELIAFGGAPLDIADDKEVSITFNLTPDLADNAPNEIPSFWLDENTGYWQEEGTASLSGTSYTFQVKHFTWWACQLYKCIDEIVVIGGTLTMDDGSPCGGCEVEIIGNESSIVRTTSSSGSFAVLSCANQTYELIGYYRGINCANNDGVSMGFYSVDDIDIDWGDIKLTDANIISISGTVYDCEPGETEEGSYVLLDDETIIETFADGKFTFLSCYEDGSQMILEGFNEAGILMSPELILDLDPAGHSGLELSTCLESDVYLDVYRDGTLVQHVGRPAQDNICDNNNKICISLGSEYFEDEYFSAVIELESGVDLNQIGFYTEVMTVNNASILYAEDIHASAGMFTGLVPVIDVLEVKEYDEYKTVYMKFQTFVGTDALELNYEVQFRIKL